jgi:hypothetical protein
MQEVLERLNALRGSLRQGGKVPRLEDTLLDILQQLVEELMKAEERS